MSKAEELAKVAFPDVAPENCPSKEIKHEEDLRRIDMRYGFRVGYHQAERDLELTWEDIKTILDIENDILRECNSHKELVIETYPKGENYYGEILKRFKERKEK